MLDKNGQKLYTFTQCKEILMPKKKTKTTAKKTATKRPVGRPRKTTAKKTMTKRPVGRPRKTKAVVYGPKRKPGRPKGSKNRKIPSKKSGYTQRKKVAVSGDLL